MRLHLDAGVQHQKKHPEIGDGDEYVVAGHREQVRERIRELDNNGAQGNPCDEFADERGLTNALGYLAKRSGRDQQDEQHIEQIHLGRLALASTGVGQHRCLFQLNYRTAAVVALEPRQ